MYYNQEETAPNDEDIKMNKLQLTLKSKRHFELFQENINITKY